MAGGKKQKFVIPNLKAKVQNLETIFGEKAMRSGLNPRTVDKWLHAPEPTPYLMSLKKYFSSIGMKESDIIQSKVDFSKRTADLFAKNRPDASPYTEADVAAILTFEGIPCSSRMILKRSTRPIPVATGSAIFPRRRSAPKITARTSPPAWTTTS